MVVQLLEAGVQEGWMVVKMVRILTRRQTSASSPVGWHASSPESSFRESRMGGTILAAGGKYPDE